MGKEDERQPDLDGTGLTIGLVAARYNRSIVVAMVESALNALNRCGATPEPVIWVPGSFELPAAAQALASSGRVDAVVCLGCVIKGETAHFEHVAGAAANGIMEVALRTGVPCTFGVLTTYDEEQARARVDKGREAAEAAIEMSRLLREVRQVGRERSAS
jgi:6,7-dimethyl-8-ribityllumazine synthase